jgi:hypothetical protein
LNSFLEHIFLEIKKRRTKNHPLVFTFNINGLSSWYSPVVNAHLFWYGNDFTGLAYREFSDGMANIFPYYCGSVLEDVELYRWTNLHKPKTEEALIEYLYKNADSINAECAKVILVGGVTGGFEDYMARLRYVLHWIGYFNSTKVV